MFKSKITSGGSRFGVFGCDRRIQVQRGYQEEGVHIWNLGATGCSSESKSV
jgi:hypothetical protein